MNSKISIIIPIYNSEKTIKRCIDSLLLQTYNNIEILLIDDGSIDNSLKICDEYSKKDKRIKYYYKQNGGVSSARNYGLNKATGEYIAFVDSDDYIECNMYELLINDIIKSKSDISICNIYFEDENKNIYYNFNHNNFTFCKEKYPEYSYYIKSISGFVWNKLYSKKIIFSNKNINIKFNLNISISEDDLFNYDILNSNSDIKYSYINDKLYHYVLNKKSESNKKFNMKKLTYFDSKEREISILESNNINSDFLKADYVIKVVRIKIIMKKLNIKSNKKIKDILCKSNIYKKEIKYANLNLSIILKIIIATKFPIIYKLKLRNSNN